MGTVKRPTNPAGLGTFVLADVVIDAGAHRLIRGGREIAVEPKAFAVLLEFLAHPGQLLSRDQILDAVWGHSYVTPATLNRLVAQLRKALADDSENPHCIQTVHGLGYRFIAPFANTPEMAAPALRFAPPAPARLPERMDPLIGREREIAELVALLADARLVTVIGPGGIGKTQAALEAARVSAAAFPDGVWLFDFTVQTSGDGLSRLLADAFGIRGAAGDAVEQLCEVLRTRRALLVLDNCERVAEPLGRLVASLLTSCAELRVLATSQQRLNCAGESLYRLPALEVPVGGDWSTAGEMARLAVVPSVQLLLVRSRSLASGFALTLSNAAAIVELCRRLEGLPLALELAAARLRMLSPEQLLLRLEDRFRWPSDVPGGRPSRHQTLGALIDWSFALLSEREQALLCALAVFAGGCTLEGAIAVGAVFGLDDEEAFDLLSGLVDKSLVAIDSSSNPPRYRLLDSVRLFTLSRLAAGDNEANVRRAHLAHFVALTARVGTEIRGGRQQLWVERMLRERANVQAAFDYAIANANLADDAVAMVANLCWYFRIHFEFFGSGRWQDAALQVAQMDSLARARALLADGIAHHVQSHEQARSLLREGIALATRLGDAWLAAAGQAMLAFELAGHGDFDDSERCVEAALIVADASGDRWLRALALLGRGIAYAMRGRHRDAEAALGEAAELVTPPEGDAFLHGYALINRALQRFHLGEVRCAAQDFLSNLDLCVVQQNQRGLAGCVEGTAYLALERGHAMHAAHFLGAAARVRNLTGQPLFRQWHTAHAAVESKLAGTLGAGFASAQKDGAVERFEDIVGDARALLVELAAG